MKKIFLVLLFVLFLVGCSQSEYSYDKNQILTDDDIRNLKIQPKEELESEWLIVLKGYPKIVGKHYKNNLTLSLIYFCSDVCPRQGHLTLVYDGVDAETCYEVDGELYHDAAWGAYIGCKPILGTNKTFEECNSLSNHWAASECFLPLIVEFKDFSFCENITKEHIREYCYLELFNRVKLSLSDCDEFSNENLTYLCKGQYVINTKDYDYCITELNKTEEFCQAITR